MKKTVLKLSAIAGVMLAGISMAHAADDAAVTVTGHIVTHSCNISASTNDVQLGNHAADEFNGPTTQVGPKNFLVAVSACSGTLPADSGAKLALQVLDSGVTNDVDAFNYWGDAGGTGTGIGLQSMFGGSVTDVTPKDNTITLLVADETDDIDLSGQSFNVPLVAYLKAPSKSSVKTGEVKAPLVFTMAYD